MKTLEEALEKLQDIDIRLAKLEKKKMEKETKQYVR